jgi:hypothetical protein
LTGEFIDAAPCRRCGAGIREVVHDARDYSIRECPFCGASERGEPRRAVQQKPLRLLAASADAEYRLPHGRFAGKTLAEVYADEAGRQYLDFMRNDPRLRDVIEAFMFSISGYPPS